MAQSNTTGAAAAAAVGAVAATATSPIAAVSPLTDNAFDMDDMKHCFDNLIVIDAGANLTNKKYSRDLDSVIQRAKDAGKLIFVEEDYCLKSFGFILYANLSTITKKTSSSSSSSSLLIELIDHE